MTNLFIDIDNDMQEFRSFSLNLPPPLFTFFVIIPLLFIFSHTPIRKIVCVRGSQLSFGN